LLLKRLLGTPTEEQWPGVCSLRDWHEYPRWQAQSLARAVPTLEPEGLDLLSVNYETDIKCYNFLSVREINNMLHDKKGPSWQVNNLN
jgi:hypothetical protein